MTTYRLPFENLDLSVHDDPPPRWDRVAVACGWKDAHIRRKRWPHAAVVGPMRTLRGIDLLVRGLLANPQIRAVIVDGPDLTPGEATRQALLDFWTHGTRPPGFGDDITDEHCTIIRYGVALIPGGTPGGYPHRAMMANTDRNGGTHLLPPPVTTLEAGWPIGPPGERIAGRILGDVWPQALQRILRYGRDIPSQHGATRELLHLVTTYSDPLALVAEVELELSPWLGFDEAAMREYAHHVTTNNAPPDAPYSYGTRIGGDQFGEVSRQLQASPGGRAIGVSPWRPAWDLAGFRGPRPWLRPLTALARWLGVTWAPLVGERVKGRPCLVWAQFRAIGDELHLFFVFRSHDYYAAYPLNVAAMACWLLREADRAGLRPGTLTCVSVSAHLYERDWSDAQKVVDDHSPKGPQWDQRSTWHVELIEGKLRAHALSPDGAEPVATFDASTPQALRQRIASSGLLTTSGNALWLGSEIERVYRGGR